jgi:hypothetical protein
MTDMLVLGFLMNFMSFRGNRITAQESARETQNWRRYSSNVMDCPAGIGFTVPLFVSTVAFPAGSSLDIAKVDTLFRCPFSVQYTLRKVYMCRKNFRSKLERIES